MQHDPSLLSTVITSAKSTGPLTEYLQKLLDDNRRFFLLCDDNTFFNCLPVLQNSHPIFKTIPVIKIRSGEKRKTLKTCEAIWNELLLHRADRKSVLINLGGGVITDMGGFAASAFKRGIDCIHIPTTLLAMTDAALGGKTAVNISNYKNQVGSFIQPLLVFNFLPFLKTQSPRQLKNGLAEILKHGLISDANYFNQMVRTEDFATQTLIEHSINIKEKITLADPSEKAERKLLNFGHTIGHAVEAYFQSQRKDLLHGEAVAIGILCESFISTQQQGLSQEDFAVIKTSIDKFYDLKKFTFSIDDIFEYMLADKKNTDGRINFTLLKSIGNAVYDCTADKVLIEKSIKWYFNN